MMDSNVKLEKISYERILWYLSHGMYGYHIMWDSDLLRPSHKILSWNWDNVSSLIPATNQVHQKRLHYKLIIIIIFFFKKKKTIFKQWVLLGSLFMFVGQQIALSTMLLIRLFLVLMPLGLFPSPIFGPIHLKRTLEFGWVIVLSFNKYTHTQEYSWHGNYGGSLDISDILDPWPVGTSPWVCCITVVKLSTDQICKSLL